MSRAIVLYVVALILAMLLAVGLTPMQAQADGEGVLLRMFDWGGDLEARYGVPIGSVHEWAWDTINPARGVYNWAPVDAALAKEDALGKPVMTQVIFYYSSSSRPGWNYGFYDATPGWVYDNIPHATLGGRKTGHVVADANGNKAAVPAYDQAAWRNAYYDMVRAFGARYDGRVLAVVCSVGLDGETQATKGSWMTALRGTAIERGFGEFVYATMEVYAESFDATTVYLNNAPGDTARKPRAEKAVALGLGLKHSGLKPDLDSYTGYGRAVGSWDMMNVYSTTAPLWIESAYGWMNAENRYWSLPAALHYHPRGIDLHAGWFDDLSRDDLRWLYAHVRAQTPADAPSVWTMLRDAEYPLQGSPSSYAVSGKLGNWEYWLYQTNQADTPMVARPYMPTAKDAIESRQCRRTDQGAGHTYMAFAIDRGFAAPEYEAAVTYLDVGRDQIAVSDGVTKWVRAKANTGGWVTWRVTVRGDFRVSCEGDGDEYVHRVDVTRAGAAETPTVLPSVQIMTKTVTICTPTKTPMATSSPTWQPTATPTRIETPIVLPSVTATLSRIPTFAPTVQVRHAELVCVQYVIHYDDGTTETIDGECHGGGK